MICPDCGSSAPTVLGKVAGRECVHEFHGGQEGIWRDPTTYATQEPTSATAIAVAAMAMGALAISIAVAALMLA